MVVASAPGKLVLFGEHAVVYGYPCIVTAVNRRMYVEVETNGTDVFHMDAPDVGLYAYSKTIADLGGEGLPKGVRFVEEVYRRFLDAHPQKQGINVVTRSEFSADYGFGSSSAVTVAFAKALTELYKVSMNEDELFELCCESVLTVQGVGSGFDIAAAIWGGTIYFINAPRLVEKIEVKTLPLVVGYTGVKADTPTLVRMVAHRMSQKKESTTGIMEQISQITQQARVVMKASDWRMLGELMMDNHALLKKLGVSSDELERLVEAVSEVGYGAKLSGAGGGDCMIGIGENVETMQQRVDMLGGKVLPVELQAEGVRLE
jgi:mevalonate kinase